MIIKINNTLKSDDSDIKIPLPITIKVKEFTIDSSNKFCEDMEKAHKTGQNVIPVIINSYGGSVHSLFSMIDIIKQSELPIMTICNGISASAAVLFLSSGTKGLRYITENSTIMIHSVSAGTFGKVDEMKIDVKEFSRLNNLMLDLLDFSCNQTSGFFKQLLKKNENLDLYITPTRALELKIIDKIGFPDLTYNISHKFNI